MQAPDFGLEQDRSRSATIAGVRRSATRSFQSCSTRAIVELSGAGIVCLHPSVSVGTAGQAPAGSARGRVPTQRALHQSVTSPAADMDAAATITGAVGKYLS